jgi:hypothetical protein
VGKGAIDVHGLTNGTTQHRAHQRQIGVKQEREMVGTALRRACGKALPGGSRLCPPYKREEARHYAMD